MPHFSNKNVFNSCTPASTYILHTSFTTPSKQLWHALHARKSHLRRRPNQPAHCNLPLRRRNERIKRAAIFIPSQMRLHLISSFVHFEYCKLGNASYSDWKYIHSLHAGTNIYSTTHPSLRQVSSYDTLCSQEICLLRRQSKQLAHYNLLQLRWIEQTKERINLFHFKWTLASKKINLTSFAHPLTEWRILNEFRSAFLAAERALIGTSGYWTISYQPLC